MAVEANGSPVSPDLNVTTRLAYDRTRLANDRTMMAWVRTSTSMITFGFSVYKFFQIERATARPAYVIGPREFSLLLVCLGVIALVVATLEYRASMKTLIAEYPGIVRSQVPVVTAALLSVLGLLAVLAILFRQ